MNGVHELPIVSVARLRIFVDGGMTLYPRFA